MERRSVSFEDGAAPLWGPDAVRALRASVAVAVADEEQLLGAMRASLGPYASESQLRHHLRNSHAKLHWAVNGYLREAVLAACACAAPPDFVPTQPKASLAAAFEGTPTPPLPAALWSLVLQRLAAPDVRAAACVCRSLRAAADSQSLWQRLYAARWGALAAASVAGCWRLAYRERGLLLASLRCPLCSTAARPLTPVVYGFPSPALVAAQREGWVLLGGDYLIETNPCWACTACGAQWRAWPWRHGGPAEQCASGRLA